MMDLAGASLTRIVPLFVMLASGFLFKQAGLMKAETVAGIKSLVARLTLPAVVFIAFSAVQLDGTTAVTFAVVFPALVLALSFALALEALRGTRSPRPFLMTAFEAGMLGFPLFSILVGVEHVSRMALADLGEIVFTFLVLIPLMGMRNGSHSGPKQALSLFIRNPVIWAVFLGLLSSALGLGRFFSETLAGKTLISSLSFIAAPTGVLILFVVGYDLDFSRKNLGWAVPTIILRYLVMVPLLFLVRFLVSYFGGKGVDHYLIVALMMLFIMPPSFAISLFGKEGEESEYISTTLSLNTLVTVVVLSLFPLQ